MYKSDLMYHIVFVTKYRKRCLCNKILQDIEEILQGVSKLHNFEFVEFGSENNDHIHIIIKTRPTQKISLIVQLMKQYTRYYIWQKYSVYLRQFYWYNNYLWSSGYFCSTLGNVSKDIVLKYVENQYN